MEKKRLYIDLDGVLADFDKAIENLDKSLLGIDIEDPVRKKKVKELCKNTPQFFLDLEPIEGALEAVSELFALDKFEIYFLSAPMWEVPNSYTEKRLWVERYFGEQSKDLLILTPRKDIMIGDFLVDDREKFGRGFQGTFLHFGLNRNYPTWKEVLAYLKGV